MSWLQHDLPNFAYITANGDLILFDELQCEVMVGLEDAGFQVDHWPLTVTLQTIRAVTATYDGAAAPSADHFIDGIAHILRQRRLLLTRPLIRSILAEYLIQLRRHDIARVQYY
jgi:hypothetical protein